MNSVPRAGTSQPHFQPRSFQDVDDILRQIELRNELLARTLDGWSVWVVLRWAVAMQLIRLPFAARREEVTWLRRAKLGLSDCRGWLRLPRARILAQTYSSALLEEEDGRYKDIWMDELIRRLDSVIKIEQVNNAAFIQRHDQALIPSHLTTTLLEIGSSLLARMWQPRRITELGKDLRAALQRELGDDTLAQRTIESVLAVFYWRKRLWSLILSKIKPAIVLVADPGEFGLIAAAKERGVRVIEIQHGIVDQYNPSYSWTAGALAHRSTMPIPDVLFLHGEHWRQELAKNGFWRDELCVVGNPRVDLYRSRRAERRANDLKTVVFTSQGIALEAAATILAGCLDNLNGGDGVRLIVKLHPVYDDDDEIYRRKLKRFGNVSIFRGNEGPSTLDLLSSAYAHVSISSATHYDAIALGVPTIVLLLPSCETVTPLIENGHARAVSTSQALAALFDTGRSLSVDPALSEYFCKTGAVGNMLQKLNHWDDVVDWP